VVISPVAAGVEEFDRGVVDADIARDETLEVTDAEISAVLQDQLARQVRERGLRLPQGNRSSAPADHSTHRPSSGAFSPFGNPVARVGLERRSVVLVISFVGTEPPVRAIFCPD
jgi:hypothetical protein